jgi:peptidoglycan/LPS O-acetylase OafA/YrhL
MITIGFLMVGPSGPYFGSSLTENLDETFLSRFAWPFPLFFTNLVYAFNYTSIGSHQFAWWAPSFLGVTWSISLEEQMYLIFPVLLSLAMRWPRVTLICLIAFAMLARIGFLFMPVWNASMENAGGMYYATFSYLDLLVLVGWRAGQRPAGRCRRFSPGSFSVRFSHAHWSASGFSGTKSRGTPTAGTHR